MIGWMVIIGRRQSKSTKSNNFVKPIRDIHCDTNLVFFLIVQRGGGRFKPMLKKDSLWHKIDIKFVLLDFRVYPTYAVSIEQDLTFSTFLLQ